MWTWGCHVVDGARPTVWRVRAEVWNGGVRMLDMGASEWWRVDDVG